MVTTQQLKQPYVFTGLLAVLFLFHFLIFGYSPIFGPTLTLQQNVWIILLWLGVWTGLLFIDRRANFLPTWAAKLTYWYVYMRTMSLLLVVATELLPANRWSCLAFNILHVAGFFAMMIWYAAVHYYQRGQAKKRAKRRLNHPVR